MSSRALGPSAACLVSPDCVALLPLPGDLARSQQPLWWQHPWPASEGQSPGDGPAAVFVYELSDAGGSSTDCKDGRFGQMFTYVRPKHGSTDPPRRSH